MLWFTYGVILGKPPIFVANSIYFCATMTLAYMKITYKDKKGSPMKEASKAGAAEKKPTVEERVCSSSSSTQVSSRSLQDLDAAGTVGSSQNTSSQATGSKASSKSLIPGSFGQT